MAQPRFQPQSKEFGTQFSTQFEEAQPTKLLIKYSNWKFTKAEILDAADPAANVLYNLEFHMTKPHVVLTVPNEPTAFATANQHALSTKIDIDVRGQSFEMKPVSKWSQKDYTFTSPALQGQTLTWKVTHAWTKGEAVCLTENGESLGRVRLSYYNFKQAGELDISGLATQRTDLREEVVTTGLMMGYLFWQKVTTSASSSSSSAGVAAAVSG